jgi:putative tricarboxylic transport membrane protein
MMIKSAAGVFKRKPTEDYTVIAVADPVPPGGYFLLVNSDSDIKSLDDLIAKAKANPGKLLYGVEMGGSSHVMGGTLAKAAGIEFKFVESGADTEKLTALVGKTLDVISCNPNQARQYVQAERARALACFSKSDGKRSEILPEVPTFMELGLDFSFDGPQFILGPKNMDPALARKIHAYYEAAAKDEGVNKVLQPAGQEIRILSFEEGPEKLKRMQAEFDTMVEELGIKRR